MKRPWKRPQNRESADLRAAPPADLGNSGNLAGITKAADPPAIRLFVPCAGVTTTRQPCRLEAGPSGYCCFHELTP